MATQAEKARHFLDLHRGDHPLLGRGLLRALGTLAEAGRELLEQGTLRLPRGRCRWP